MVMDREQEEMQNLDPFGICKEASKVIFSLRKIFSQITLTLILPLSIIFLAHIELTDVLYDKITNNEHALQKSVEGTTIYHKISHAISLERTMFWLVKAFYFTFLLIFSLLSTAAVVYTIACVYTARDVNFKKVMTVVPKVWKRLMVTFLCIFVAMFVYDLIFFLALVILSKLTGDEPHNGNVITLTIIVFLYIVGFAYMSIIWYLASVVSVLDIYGLPAMAKSKDLIQGKTCIALFIYFGLNSLLLGIQLVFETLVVDGKSLGMVSRLGFGILCLVIHFMLILFGLVIQTVFYFVCKSYHHENIDKGMLSDQLEVYLLGESVPLMKAKEIQLEPV